MTTTNTFLPRSEFAGNYSRAANLWAALWRVLILIAVSLLVVALASTRVAAQVPLITQAITFGPNPGPITSPNNFLTLPDFNVSATGGSSGNPILFTSLTPAVCNTLGGFTGGGVAGTKALGNGTCIIAANQAGSATHAPAPQVTQSISITGVLLPQTITFDPTPATVNPVRCCALPDFTVSATGGSSGNPIVFTSLTPDVCSSFGLQQNFIGNAPGTCIIAADQAGNATYAPALRVTRSITILKRNQMIVFGTNPGPVNFTLNGTFAVSAKATPANINHWDTGNPVFFTSLTTSVCSVAGSTVTTIAPGTCTIAANQPGNANDNPAPQVTQSIVISALASQNITFDPIFGEVVFNSTGIFAVRAENFASAQSFNLISITSLTPSVCSVINANSNTSASGSTSGAVMSILARGRCTVAANQAGNASYSAAPQVTLNIDILREAQILNFTPIPQKNVGDAPFSMPVTVSSGLPLTLFTLTTSVCSITGATITIIGRGHCHVYASQAGNASYAPITDQFVTFIDVLGRAQTITFLPIADRPASPTPFPVNATASSGLPITNFNSFSGACYASYDYNTMPPQPIVRANSVGTCTVTAEQSGNGEYEFARAEQTFNISRGTQTIVVSPISNVTYPAFGVTANARATGASFNFVYPVSLTPTVCSTSSSNTLISIQTAGICALRFSHLGDVNYFPAPDVDVSFTIAKGTQSISLEVSRLSAIVGDAPATISVYAFSNNFVTAYDVTVASNTPQICTVSSNTVSFTGSGTCILTATQPGNANYLAAAPVTRTIQVAPRAALQSSSVISRFGDMQTLTANIAGTSPTGTTRFSLGTGEVIPGCAAVPVVNASASCLIPPRYQSLDPLIFSVDYSGDARNPAGTSRFQQAIFYDLAALSTSIAPANPVPAGGRATVTALVRMRSPVGTVSFVTDEYAPVTSALVRTPLAGCDAKPLTMLPNAIDSAVATCTLTAPISGSAKVTAIYRYPADHVSRRSVEEESQVVNVVTSPPVNYTDMWWGGARENGWGVSITQHGATQFNVIFAYDSAGKPTWYVMPGCTWSAANTVCTGSLYQPTGAPYSAYDVTRFAANAPVGTGTFTYKSASTATLSYTILGVAGSKEIERQLFGTATTGSNLGVNDLWWNGVAENGWGINIAQQGRQLFPVWYTYGADGKPTFFTVPGGTWNGLVFSGDIYTTTSSPWLGVPYDASRFAASKVGTMIIDYRDANTATISYTIGAVTQTKVITRQAF